MYSTCTLESISVIFQFGKSILRSPEVLKLLGIIFGKFLELPSNFGTIHVRRKPKTKISTPVKCILNTV